MKKYTLEVIETDDSFTMKSKNDGFTSFEVLGILHCKKDDIVAQIKGDVKPDMIKREFLIDPEIE